MERNSKDEQLFIEKIKTLGFKTTGVRNLEDVPKNTLACLLLTNDEKLRRRIMASAYKNNFLVVFNPEIIERKHCIELFAFIMDESEKAKFPYPDLLSDKYVDANLDIKLIDDFVLALKHN